ncbi:MAG: class I SAM-dependent methyltransferase [Flavisolibacter sp.]|nr:class I SAM-dependent methyltransferase [Flavisolibacter sp.]MBD0350335.1 class I SAM-dependent methyltransferase [Flavisolibacter sp.]
MIFRIKQHSTIQRLNHNNVWKVADAQKLPFEDSYFDLVLCQFGVMFFPDKEKAFGETHRVLKDEEQFLFNTLGNVPEEIIKQRLKEVLTTSFGAKMELPMSA